MCSQKMKDTQSYSGRKFHTCHSRGKEVAKEKHQSHEAGVTGHSICSTAPISGKRDAGMTHTVTQSRLTNLSKNTVGKFFPTID